MALQDVLLHVLRLLRYLLWPLESVMRRPGVKASEVAEIVVYPVKGCRGISVRKARIKSTGFYYDRHWVIASEEKGRMKTQRSDPRIALIEVSLPSEAILGNLLDLPHDASVELRAPGTQPLQVPLLPHSRPGAAVHNVSIWEWKGQAWDEGDAAASWLSAYLDKPARLLRYAGDEKGKPPTNPARRPTDKDFAAGYETAFADGFPFLLANKASLSDLNTRLGEQLPMNRFRPNVIVSGAEPWQEDTWQAFRIAHEGAGSISFRSVKPCSRCKVTTTNQATAEVSKEMEPLKTLGTFRSGQFLGWKRRAFAKEVFFGWNLVAETGFLGGIDGFVSVGDDLLVSKWRESASAA